MQGEIVVVGLRVESEIDAGNNIIYKYSEWEPVLDVLVSPGPRADITESTRPHGKLVKYTLHFPKPYAEDLEGAKVIVRGKEYSVIGAPDHYIEENTPTRWWMPVEVEAVHG